MEAYKEARPKIEEKTMFWKKEDNKNIELLEHRVQQLEDQQKQLKDMYAIKLVERIVFAAAAAILLGAITTTISGVSLFSLFGG